MEQLTKEQAIAFFDSGVWKNWSAEDIVKMQLYQNKLCVPFDTFHMCLTFVLKRPVYTHEMMNVKDLQAEYLGEKCAPTLKDIMDMIPQEKRIIIFKK